MTDVERDASIDDEVAPRRSRLRGARGSVITLATVVALLAATALTILGIGAADNALGNFDANSWLWSSDRGELDRANATTSKVDTRMRVGGSQNHPLQVTQTDKYLIIRDLETGEISALDLSTLQVSSTTTSTPGLGISIALQGETAFVIDSVQGQVRQLNPLTLAPTGDPIRLPHPLTAGAFDGQGMLWVGVPSEGTVAEIKPGDGVATSPQVVNTFTVSPPQHDLVLSALDTGVAILDNTDDTLVTVVDRPVSVSVPITGAGAMPGRSQGSPVLVTVGDSREIVVVDGKTVRQFTVPGSGSLSPAVVFAGRVYVADGTANAVLELDLSGNVLSQIVIPDAGGVLELEVREDHLFINAPNGPDARIVSTDHQVTTVDKYQSGVVGADPPPPPPPPPTPPTPPITVPGPPQNVVAAAGDRTATVSWQAADDGGSPILHYVVEGAGQSVTVGTSFRSADFKDLVNGESYTFTVRAVNKIGDGPAVETPPVTPTADVPDAPTAITATANPDGTVTLTWPAANGEGRPITSYRVTSISAGAQAPAGDTTETSLTIPAGALDYGTEYAFEVVAINDLNAASDSSPTSETVIPFTVPDAPDNVRATAVTNARGAITVTWDAPASNGRTITKYVVTPDSGQPITVPMPGDRSVTLTGLADDTPVSVTVHAVNEAGDGPTSLPATARTIAKPSLTLTGASSGGYTSVKVTFTPDNGGGDATCVVAITGGPTASQACDTSPRTVTVTGLWPNNTYGFTVTITTAAGTASATGSVATNQLYFTVISGASGVWAYTTPSQSNRDLAVAPALNGGASGVPQCHITGDDVDARPWGGADSNTWLRFSYSGTAYFPYAWATIDGGDLNNLPAC